MSVPLSAFGITLPRSFSTRSVVASSAGPFAAITLKYAVVPALSICIAAPATTPGVAEMSFCSDARRGSAVRGSVLADAGFAEEEPPPEEPDLPDPPPPAADVPPDAPLPGPEPAPLPEADAAGAAGALAGVPSEAATISGPLMPGPKLAVSRS